MEEFQVIETPGHTKCSVSFIFSEKRIIFVGDAAGVIDNGIVRPQFLSDYPAYISSLEKIKKWSNFSLALGHGGIFEPGETPEFLGEAFKRSLEFGKEIERLYSREGNEDRVAEIIYKREYERLRLRQPKKAYMINLKAMIKTVLKEAGTQH